MARVLSMRPAFSQLFAVLDHEVNTADPAASHDTRQPPGYRPADPAIEERVKKGADQQDNRQEIEEDLHNPDTAAIVVTLSKDKGIIYFNLRTATEHGLTRTRTDERRQNKALKQNLKSSLRLIVQPPQSTKSIQI
jgi:hypothetical protein